TKLGGLKSMYFSVFAAHQCDGDLDHFNEYKALHPHHVNSNWMKCIPDAQSLSAVSIPGTDQSLKEGGVNPYRNFQAWKLSSQLYAGVRFFDMTVWISFGTLYVANNAVYYYEYFDHAVSELQNFLSVATSETLLLRFTGYADAISLAKEMLSKGTGFHLWKDRNIPKMGEARGKIVLIQSPDFDWGLPINAMELPTEDKITQMKANIEYASEHCQNEMMLTDTGAKGQYEIPLTVAEKLNKQLDDYLLSLLHLKKQPSCIGIISTPKPTTESTPKPETEPTPKPTTEPTPKPTTEPTHKPATEPTHREPGHIESESRPRFL
uniref:Uncharacterized protein n=1 Tax=Astyanax mexicanus TaxID=7994 RepID=A0A8B9R7A3_ASTMX